MSDEGAHEGRLSEDLSEERGTGLKKKNYLMIKKSSNIYYNSFNIFGKKVTKLFYHFLLFKWNFFYKSDTYIRRIVFSL